LQGLNEQEGWNQPTAKQHWDQDVYGKGFFKNKIPAGHDITESEVGSQAEQSSEHGIEHGILKICKELVITQHQIVGLHVKSPREQSHGGANNGIRSRK